MMKRLLLIFFAMLIGYMIYDLYYHYGYSEGYDKPTIDIGMS